MPSLVSRFKLVVAPCGVENLHQVKPAAEGPPSTVSVGYAPADRFYPRFESHHELETT
jgi:hypothetical protein